MLTESAEAMRGLEGHVVLNCTEKPKSADYKKLGLNGTNASSCALKFLHV